MKKIAFITVWFVWGVCFCKDLPAFPENFPAKIKKPVNESISIRLKTQKAKDEWAGERLKLKTEYEALELETKLRTKENIELEKKLLLLEASVKALKREIKESSRLSRELAPFLQQTFERLEQLVKEDIPFLKDERKRRLENLRRVLFDPMITTAEKFRKIMEALSIEAEYGNTIEVYQENITLNGKKMQVDIFRLGRISLFFQTPDEKTTGYFDPALSIWKALPHQYKHDVKAAMEMGAKRRSVDLLNLPLGKVVAR